VPERRARAAEGPGEGHVEHAQPLLVGHLEDARVAAEPGVVDDHVEPAVVAHDRVDHRLDVVLTGHVAADREGCRARRLDQTRGGFAEPALVGVTERDPRSLLETPKRGRKPDPRAGGGGHEHGLAGEQAVAARGEWWGG